MPNTKSSLRSVSLLSIGSIGQMGLQFAFQLLLARYFGAKAEMDAYNAAVLLPLVVSGLLAGALHYAFVPVFVARREHDGAAQAWETATLLLACLIVAVTLLSLLGSIAARPLMTVLAPGDDLERAIDLFRKLVWLTATMTTASFLQALYQSEHRFLPTAIAPMLGSALTIAWTIAFHEARGIEAVASGALAGSVLTVCLQMPIFLRNFRLKWELDPGARHTLRLLIPLLLGAVYYKLDPVLDYYLVKRVSQGAISHLAYSTRILGVLLTLTTGGLAMVVFPVMARHSAAGRIDELKLELAYALRFLIFVLTPATVAWICFHEALIHDIFERGQFTPHDTTVVGRLVALSMGTLVAASAGEILSKVSFALGDTRTPVLIGALSFTLGAALKITFAPRVGVAGVVLATSFYYSLSACLQYCWLHYRLGPFLSADMWKSAARAMFGAGGAALVGLAIIQCHFPFSSLVAGAVGTLVYGCLTRLVHDEFALKLFQAFLPRDSSGMNEATPPNIPAP